jgi:YHS domain-containing protein
MKGAEMFKTKNIGINLLICMFLFAVTVFAASPINIGSNGVAIKGYDPVAYFTMDKPVKGNNDFEYEWKGVKWRFSTENHMKLFIKDPDKYAPRYGGYCAYGVAVDALFDIKPEAWSIVDRKLYLNKNLDVRETWRKDIPGNIKKADMNWPGILNK